MLQKRLQRSYLSVILLCMLVLLSCKTRKHVTDTVVASATEVAKIDLKTSSVDTSKSFERGIVHDREFEVTTTEYLDTSHKVIKREIRKKGALRDFEYSKALLSNKINTLDLDTTHYKYNSTLYKKEEIREQPGAITLTFISVVIILLLIICIYLVIKHKIKNEFL